MLTMKEKGVLSRVLRADTREAQRRIKAGFWMSSSKQPVTTEVMPDEFWVA